jgi:hypothetical protein
MRKPTDGNPNPNHNPKRHHNPTTSTTLNVGFTFTLPSAIFFFFGGKENGFGIKSSKTFSKIFGTIDFQSPRLLHRTVFFQDFYTTPFFYTDFQIFQDFPRLGQDGTKVADKKSWPIGGEKSPYTRQKYFSSFITRKFCQAEKKGRNRPEVVC